LPRLRHRSRFQAQKIDVSPHESRIIAASVAVGCAQIRSRAMARHTLPFSRRKALHHAILKRNGIQGRVRFQPIPERMLDPASEFEQPPETVTPSNTVPVRSVPIAADSSRSRLVTLQRAPFAVRVLNNLTAGATAASIAEFNALGANDRARLTAFVDQQLNPSSIDDSALEARLSAVNGYTTLGKSLSQLWADHQLVNTDSSAPARETQRAALMRAAYSKRQLQETLVDFWQNHFNVAIGNNTAATVYVHYNRDVIRANVFGNFRTMLEAVGQSTAMMYYLNNRSNSRSGPNENYARELLELHAMGAENYLGFVNPTQVPPAPEDPNFPIGYTDLDVYDTAAAFTGWTVKNGGNGFPSENDGTFVYRQAMHDAGPKQVLGMYILPEQAAMKDGRDIYDRLANHPRVAKFICKKLIRRFVSDNPDPALIDSAAAIFRTHWQQPNQIALTLRHILLSDAFFYAWGQKNRRPFELLAAAMRAGGSDWTIKGASETRSNDFMSRLGSTGHAPYDWAAPNGYPDVSVTWSASNNMVTTWRMLTWLTETRDTDAGSTPLLPILAQSRANVASWTANNLVDFWCQRLLGYLPVASRRQILVSFLAQNGDPASYVITDTDSSATTDLKRHYNQQRIRSMVAMILMSPEFMTR
jgi:uncharacterized protein (DUF1800 family)